MNAIVTERLTAEIRQRNADGCGVECATQKCLIPVTVVHRLPESSVSGTNPELRSFAKFLYVRDTPVFLVLQM
jgi:hypothetical protein